MLSNKKLTKSDTNETLPFMGRLLPPGALIANAVTLSLDRRHNPTPPQTMSYPSMMMRLIACTRLSTTI